MELLSKDKQKQQEAVAGRANPYAGEAGFQLELEVLSKYVHPNLVLLIGYCIQKERKATTCSLVLEFMAGGSLLERLRPVHADPALTAQERFDVAGDVARALHYLHAEAPTPLIHQDVKSDNILLAEVGGRLVAKVADFGTARIAPQLAMTTTSVAVGGSRGGGLTHHSTGLIVGTKPYMPPVRPPPSCRCLPLPLLLLTPYSARSPCSHSPLYSPLSTLTITYRST
jgi:serine/threonine protein kinase